MNKYLIFIVISSVLFLSGCLRMYGTSSELIQTSSSVESFCYSDSVDVVEKRIQSYLVKLYSGIRKVKITNGTRISLHNEHGARYSAEIVRYTEACNTKVTMYAAKYSWQEILSWKAIFKKIDSAARKDDA